MLRNKILFYFLLLFVLNACVTQRDLELFNEGDPFPGLPERLDNYLQPVIQFNDVLHITVESDNEDAVAPYNRQQQQNMNMGGGIQNPSLFGYRVDTEGKIDYPGLGELTVAGLSTEEIRAMMKERLSAFLTNSIVNVRLLNFKISILGEVGSQGIFPISDERITIVEAIAQAGGINPLGSADDILLIRERNGLREYHHIDLHDKYIFNSPNFYLQQNDVLYVRPVVQKTATIANQSRNILPWVGLVASALNLYLLFTRL